MPVVNPMVFYWMSVFDALCLWTLGVGIILSVAGVGCLTECIDEDIHSSHAKLYKTGKRLLLVGIICLGAHIFIPSQETCEKMLIAQNVTCERVAQAADTVTDVYNDIMDLFRESKDVDQ